MTWRLLRGSKSASLSDAADVSSSDSGFADPAVDPMAPQISGNAADVPDFISERKQATAIGEGSASAVLFFGSSAHSTIFSNSHLGRIGDLQGRMV